MGACAAVLPDLKWNHSLHGPSHCMQSHDDARGCTKGFSFHSDRGFEFRGSKRGSLAWNISVPSSGPRHRQ